MNTISSNDARLVINKWKDESSPLHMLLSDSGAIEDFPTTVLDCERNWLILARYSCSGVWLSVFDAIFKYGEPREAPPAIRSRSLEKFVSCLELSWPGGGKCLLFELAR
jgi:hypothetical protein